MSECYLRFIFHRAGEAYKVFVSVSSGFVYSEAADWLVNFGQLACLLNYKTDVFVQVFDSKLRAVVGRVQFWLFKLR